MYDLYLFAIFSPLLIIKSSTPTRLVDIYIYLTKSLDYVEPKLKNESSYENEVCSWVDFLGPTFSLFIWFSIEFFPPPLVGDKMPNCSKTILYSRLVNMVAGFNNAWN